MRARRREAAGGGRREETSWFTRATGFGKLADREDADRFPGSKEEKRLEAVQMLPQRCRLALHLSGRSEDGTRTARFCMNGALLAVFVGIEDDGGPSDWVAGVTMVDGARLRIVPVESDEVALADHPTPRPRNAAEATVKRCFREVVGKDWPGDMAAGEAELNLRKWASGWGDLDVGRWAAEWPGALPGSNGKVPSGSVADRRAGERLVEEQLKDTIRSDLRTRAGCAAKEAGWVAAQRQAYSAAAGRAHPKGGQPHG